MNKQIHNYFFLCICCLLIMSFLYEHPESKGRLKITFINTANGAPVVLHDSTYINAFGEEYTISKLKYYISNISLTSAKTIKEKNSYHLIDLAKSTSFQLELKEGIYKNISFLLGVDSIRNCSGAQTGALDPMNDMFWTWNSGYVMFKMEGKSPSSTSDLARIEHHVGGYKGANNVATPVKLLFPDKGELKIKENTTTEIFIETNLDNYWKGKADIRIAEAPVCTLPGPLAKTIASNFAGMFSLKTIEYSAN